MLSIALTLLSLAPDGVQLFHQEDGQPVDQEEVWTGTLGAGLSTSSGNNERRSINAQMDAELRKKMRRYTLGFEWQYADEAVGGAPELLERRASVMGQVDFFFDEKSYVLATADFELDYNAELDQRYIAGLGYGYQVADEEDWSLSFEAGATVINEQYRDVGNEAYLSGRFGYLMAKGLGEQWTLSQDTLVFPSLEDEEDIHLEVDTRLRCDLSDNLYAQFQWLFDWDNTPADGAEREDHRLFLSVGYSF